jgi:hypothetical protein
MYTTENLIEQIKDNTSTEFAQGRFSQSTIINICNQESIKRIKPLVTDLQKEFFVITTNLSLPIGTQYVRIPKRAASRGFRSLYLQVGTDRYEIKQITRETGIGEMSTAQGLPRAFYFEADSLVFTQPVAQITTLVMVVEVSPGSLVLSTAVTTIASVDFVTGLVIASGTPTGYGVTVPFDFVQQLGFGNAALGVGITPLSVSGTSYTFTPSDLPATLIAGDYFTLAGQTPVPNMPDEAVIVLIHAVSARIFRLRGDFNAMNAEEKELQNAIIYLERALTDRVEGLRPVIQNTTSLLRGARSRRF